MTRISEADLYDVNTSTDLKITEHARHIRDPFEHTASLLQRVGIFFISANTDMQYPDYEYLHELMNSVTHLSDETVIDWLDPDEGTSEFIPYSEYVNDLVADLLLSAQGRGDDYLEYGELENDLTKIIEIFDYNAIFALANLLTNEAVNFEVAGEVLQFLGYVDHPPSHDKRLALLLHSLNAKSPWYRDGATMGLSWMRDKSAFDYLQVAIENEEHDEIKRSMEKVLEQFRRLD